MKNSVSKFIFYKVYNQNLYLVDVAIYVIKTTDQIQFKLCLNWLENMILSSSH
jgi:hypothetical protein